MWRMMYQASSVRLLILAVPVGALGAVAAKAPEDYDIVIVNQPLYAGGELVSRQGLVLVPVSVSCVSST